MQHALTNRSFRSRTPLAYLCFLAGLVALAMPLSSTAGTVQQGTLVIKPTFTRYFEHREDHSDRPRNYFRGAGYLQEGELADGNLIWRFGNFVFENQDHTNIIAYNQGYMIETPDGKPVVAELASLSMGQRSTYRLDFDPAGKSGMLQGDDPMRGKFRKRVQLAAPPWLPPIAHRRAIHKQIANGEKDIALRWFNPSVLHMIDHPHVTLYRGGVMPVHLDVKGDTRIKAMGQDRFASTHAEMWFWSKNTGVMQIYYDPLGYVVYIRNPMNDGYLHARGVDPQALPDIKWGVELHPPAKP